LDGFLRTYSIASCPVTDGELARTLADIQPEGRDDLRRVMRVEQCERGELAARLQRGRSCVARDLADLIDTASLQSEFPNSS